MVSESIKMFPVVVNPVVEVTVTVVFELDNVPPETAVVTAPVMMPPQVPAPQPTFCDQMSWPVVS